MRWSEEALSAAYGELTLQDAAATASPCPGEDVLESFLLGEIEPRARQELADHLEVCSSCASLVQELGSLAEWSQKAAAAPGPGWVAGRARGWVALAATLLLTAAGVIWWSSNRPPVLRNDVLRAAGGSAAAVTPAASSVLTEAPETFDWPDQPGAEGYRLTLLGRRGEALWHSAWLEGSRCDLPATVRAELATVGSYAWAVEVKGPVARTELGPYAFRTAPRDGP